MAFCLKVLLLGRTEVFINVVLQMPGGSPGSAPQGWPLISALRENTPALQTTSSHLKRFCLINNYSTSPRGVRDG